MTRLHAIAAAAAVAVAAGLVACGDKGSDKPPAAAAKADATPVAPAAADAAPALAADTPDAAPAEPPPPPGEFDEQAQKLYRIAGCGTIDGAPPLGGSLQAIVDKHCEALAKVVAEYREKWLDKAIPFLAEVVPDDLPDVVVYPFGGSDLITALATFPEAREITIISLEHAGDARMVDKVKGEDLVASLKENRDHLQFLYRSAFHKTTDLDAMGESGLPGHLVGSFVALQIFGYQPVTMRYFTLADDGSLDYTTKKFENVEITFRKPGGPLKTYRHIAANLANGPFKKNKGLGAYMAARAPYTAMTKASSFLLWSVNFTAIRDKLLTEMAWMISDATAPLPKEAAKHGFEQIPYGTFGGPEPAFEEDIVEKAEPFVELWAKSEKRECPIRYGYSDVKRRAHLLVTRKKP